MIKTDIGEEMYGWAVELFPITRSITGPGVRETLGYIQKLIPDLEIHSVPSGTTAFDWTVPDEWTIREAYITDESGRKLVDFKNHNLHIMGYSVPVDCWLDRDELDKHLYSKPEQPDAIPYVTSYYERRWGFCLTHNQRTSLGPGKYRVVIDSDLKPGVLNYGELILPGESEEEIFLSTYICHPSMANNELSGPVVTIALVQWLQSLKERRYTYRVVFVPETIGSVVYLSQHAEIMKKKIVAGFVVTCVGDDRTYSLMPSRCGGTLADRIAEHVLGYKTANYTKYDFLDRGSDERQYCSALIDLPVVSIMRSKHGTYPEYHTSLDDLSLISPMGLAGTFEVLQECLAGLENNYVFRATIPCEPQMSKRGLYSFLSNGVKGDEAWGMLDFLAYADGRSDLLGIADRVSMSITKCASIARNLEANDLVARAEELDCSGGSL